MKLRPPLRSVLDTLAAEGLLDKAGRDALRDATPAFAGSRSMPWYLHAVMIAVAWVAAPCIAVAPLSAIDSETGHVVIGLAGCIAMSAAHRALRHPLARHFLLAFSIVFQVVAIVGISEACNDDGLAALVTAFLFGALFFAYDDPLHRVVMVLGMLSASVVTGYEADFHNVFEALSVVALAGTALVWSRTTVAALGRTGALCRPAALGLLIGGLACAANVDDGLIRGFLWWSGPQFQPLVAGIPLWMALLVVVVLRLRQHEIGLTTRSAWAVWLGLVILAATALDRPLLPAALLAILLAFHARDAVGILFALAALVWGVIALWAGTDVETITRALSVLSTGVLLLAAWWALRRHAAAKTIGGTA